MVLAKDNFSNIHLQREMIFGQLKEKNILLKMRGRSNVESAIIDKVFYVNMAFKTSNKISHPKIELKQLTIISDEKR